MGKTRGVGWGVGLPRVGRGGIRAENIQRISDFLYLAARGQPLTEPYLHDCICSIRLFIFYFYFYLLFYSSIQLFICIFFIYVLAIVFLQHYWSL